MMKLLCKFYNKNEEVMYSSEPHIFTDEEEAFDFCRERSSELMEIYGINSVYWHFEEITSNSLEVKN